MLLSRDMSRAYPAYKLEYKRQEVNYVITLEHDTSLIMEVRLYYTDKLPPRTGYSPYGRTAIEATVTCFLSKVDH
jgi:hypothetical protein